MEHNETAGTLETATYCTVHPSVETTLRCNRCGRPMCTRCAVRTPVGYRCKECVRGQQNVYFTATPIDLVIQGALSFFIGAIAAFLISLFMARALGFFGWLIAFWVGSAVGALIADVAHRAVGKRRGRYSWLVVAGGIGISGFAVAFIFSISLTIVIFVVMAVSGAMGRLRLGR